MTNTPAPLPTQRANYRSPSQLHREISDRLAYFFLDLNGNMRWPNSMEGDILKLVHAYLTMHDPAALIARVEALERVIAEVPAPKSKSTRRHKPVRKMVRYCYLLDIEPNDDSPDLSSFLTLVMARASRNNRLDAGYRCGPIERHEFAPPTPKGKRK